MIYSLQVIESKEENIYKLNKEIIDLKLKYQELSDVEIEKMSLSSKLTSITNEKNFLQVSSSISRHQTFLTFFTLKLMGRLLHIYV